MLGRCPPRRGFVLIAVLWLTVGAATLGLTVVLAAREAVATARNRMDATRAFWFAEDCLERARTAIGDVLLDPHRAADADADVSSIWLRLDRAVRGHTTLDAEDCRVTLEPAGARLNINSGSEAALRRLFLGARLDEARADSLAAAVADWRDQDSIVRPLGAERGHYHAIGRALPRDGPFADIRELHRVRDWNAALDALVTVEPDLVCLYHAPPAVLAALPGFTPELVDLILARRVEAEPIHGLNELVDQLPESARESLLARYAEAAAAITTEPEAWTVTSRGSAGGLKSGHGAFWRPGADAGSRVPQAGEPPLEIVVEARIVRAGSRAAVVRKRSWRP